METCYLAQTNCHSKEQDKEQVLKLLNDTEDWLYEEGDDETKSAYNKQLRNMVTQ